MTTEKLKQMRIEYQNDIDMRTKLDLLLLKAIGQEELERFWKENNLTFTP